MNTNTIIDLVDGTYVVTVSNPAEFIRGHERDLFRQVGGPEIECGGLVQAGNYSTTLPAVTRRLPLEDTPVVQRFDSALFTLAGAEALAEAYRDIMVGRINTAMASLFTTDVGDSLGQHSSPLTPVGTVGDNGLTMNDWLNL